MIKLVNDTNQGLWVRLGIPGLIILDDYVFYYLRTQVKFYLVKSTII